MPTAKGHKFRRLYSVVIQSIADSQCVHKSKTSCKMDSMSKQRSQNTTPSQFSTLIAYLERLKTQYHLALSAFYVYQTLHEARGIDAVGKETAEANAVVLSHYKEFFIPVMEAVRQLFFLELAKLFDASDDALHLNKVVNYAASNTKRLTREAFFEHNTRLEREFAIELAKQYEGLSRDDLTRIKTLLAAHKETLAKLKDYRDQWLAHNQKKKPDTPLIYPDEIKSLFDIFAQILNIFSGKLMFSTTLWDHVEENVANDTTLVLDHLRRFEPYRLKEIWDEQPITHKKIEEDRRGAT